MRFGRAGFGLVVGALAIQACGGETERRPDVHVESGGSGARMGSGGVSGSTGDGGDAGGDSPGTGGTGGSGGSPSVPGAPTVEIRSPAEVDDPNAEGVIVEEQLEVVCRVTKGKGGSAVDPSTVVIEMLDAEGAVVETFAGMPTDVADEYTARFVTTKVARNGPIAFRCLGGDESSPPFVGVDTVETFVDHGPTITIELPMAGSPHALIGAVPIVFRVDPAPVSDDDELAEVAEVSLEVGGEEIPEIDEDDGEYSVSVDLTDKDRFKNPPDGATEIMIRATNRRAPSATRILAYDFLVDGEGPVVQIIEPDGSVPRGGKVTLVFTVVDALAGVNPETVVARLNGEEFRYDEGDTRWGGDGVDFRFTFDTKQLGGSKVKANIDVTATDNVGNASEGDSLLLNLDSIPPIVDLDPFPVREYKKDSTGTCSHAFDAVGPNAANDLQRVYGLRLFRALVWDRTNQETDQTVLYHAVTNLDSVYVYLQGDVDHGLLYDSDGDGLCDEVYKEDPVSTELLAYQHLTPVPPMGAAWFGSAETETPTLNAALPIGSCPYENQSVEPQHLCPPANASDMTRVISWDYDSTVPAIFSIGPLTGAACAGTDWPLSSVGGLKEGWICVAARAEDNTENVGISRPLRLCYDDEKGEPPSCLDPGADPPPSCVVDDCELPPKFEGGFLVFH